MILPYADHKLYKVLRWTRNSDDDQTELADNEQVESLDQADVVSSELSDGSGLHSIMIDLDVPAARIESTTPGHHHLYVDVVTTWEKYTRLLDALIEVGAVEPGYVGASKARGFTAVRLPWVAKPGVEFLVL